VFINKVLKIIFPMDRVPCFCKINATNVPVVKMAELLKKKRDELKGLC
jgi:hypothetical protein